MELKAYSESRNYSVPDVKRICKTVFGSIPKTLTDEQITALDVELNKASEAVAALKPSENNNQIATTTPDTITRQVIDIVGAESLTKNMHLIRKQLIISVSNLLQEHRALNSKLALMAESEMRRANHEMVNRLAQSQIATNKETTAIINEFSAPIEFSSVEDITLTEEEKQWMLAELSVFDVQV